ncbi:MAG: DUF998 domain-containing protein [Micromonosporaceae bacterium]
MTTQHTTGHAPAPGARGSTASAGQLLAAGAAAGPIFIVVALMQAFTREGFDWTRHPTSMLALGDKGWIQIANFVVAAALFFASAIGLRRALRGKPGGTWAPILVGTFSVALLIAGVFPTDAGLGFPPGAPEGFPEFSWHGIVHTIGPTIGINSLFVSFFVFARHFAWSKQRPWTFTSIAAGIVGIALGFATNLTGTGEITDPFNFLPLWFAMMTGWSYLSLLSWKVRSELPPHTEEIG